MFDGLSVAQQRFIRRWIVGLAVIFLLFGSLSIGQAYKQKLITSEIRAVRMDPSAPEFGRTPAAPLPVDGDFVQVKVGLYLDGITALSLKESYWDATFFIWFTWKGDRSFDPGKSFQVVDGKILSKDLGETYTSPEGVNYQSYKVYARISKFFNIGGVPLDSHMLEIEIEDGARDVSRLRFIADDTADISSRVVIPGYQIQGISSVVKAHTYKSNHGDPRYVAQAQRHITFSGYKYHVQIKRAGFGIYVKLFIGLFAGVILTLCSFFARASDLGPRFGIPSAAYFGSVANAYVVNGLLPPGSQFGFADFITGLGLGTIALCVVATLVSSHYDLHQGQKHFAKCLDRVSFVVIGLGYLSINIVLPLVVFGY